MSTRFLLAALFLTGLVAPAGAEQPAAPQACSRPAKGGLRTTTYAVADLVIPVDREPRCIVVGTTKTTTTSPWKQISPVEGIDGRIQADKLIKLITTTIQPRSWSEMGGPGTIEYFPLTLSLVINQTPDVQDQVADLLAALRRLQDQEVSLEVRIVSVPESFFCERIEVDFDHAGPEGPKVTTSKPLLGGRSLKTKGIVLDHSQLVHLMEVLQTGARTNVMQTPKLTVFNGQRANFCAGDDQAFVTGMDVRVQNGHLVVVPKTETVFSGLDLSIQPVIAADRRSIRVDLQATLQDVDTSPPLIPVHLPIQPVGGAADEKPVVFTQFLQQPCTNKLSVTKNFSVPGGRTMVLDAGTRTREARNEYGTPILSDLPLIGRLFRTVGYGKETERVLLLVTPQIIVPREEEERQKSAGCTIPPAVVPCPVEESGVAPDPAKKACGKKVAALLAKYRFACEAGRLDEARKLAGKALAIDPACFCTLRP
jgi:type II secretory pathway component GspD/PulD (secretin)